MDEKPGTIQGPVWLVYMASLRAYLVGFYGQFKGLFGQFCGQFKGLFRVVLRAILWAYYLSHLTLRIKGVITLFCNNMPCCCCLIKC